MRLPLTIVMICFLTGTVSGQSESAESVRKKHQEQLQMQFLMMRLTNIVHNKSLRDELELVDEQLEEVSSLSRSFQRAAQKFQSQNGEKINEIQELQRRGESTKAQQLSREFQDGMFKVLSKNYEAVEKALLPHQLKRIKQISRQEALKNFSAYGDEFGIPLALADEIDLTASEKRKLQEAIEKARKSYYAELEKLKRNTHSEIQKSIPAEKRNKIKEIVGELFDASDSRRKNLDEIRKRKRTGF